MCSRLGLHRQPQHLLSALSAPVHSGLRRKKTKQAGQTTNTAEALHNRTPKASHFLDLELGPRRAAQNQSLFHQWFQSILAIQTARRQRGSNEEFSREKSWLSLALWPLLPNYSHSASAWPAAVGSQESGLCDRHGALTRGLEPRERSASPRPSDRLHCETSLANTRSAFALS